jgi:hypothetical protein
MRRGCNEDEKSETRKDGGTGGWVVLVEVESPLFWVVEG